MADSMPQPGAPTVLAIIQAGGKGSRMGVLTQRRAKPALPFGGTHQLIDIALSNLANSGIGDIWVSVQYLAGTLDKHLQHGRPWDLDRNLGGFRRIVPEEVDAARTGGFATGNADDLYRIRDQIATEAADVTVVLSADQAFTLDLRDVIAEHLRKGSDATIVTTEVSRTEAANKAVVTTDATGRVTRIEEKPDDAEHGTISAEVFVYRTSSLLEALENAEAEVSAQGGNGRRRLGPGRLRGASAAEAHRRRHPAHVRAAGVWTVKRRGSCRVSLSLQDPFASSIARQSASLTSGLKEAG